LARGEFERRRFLAEMMDERAATAGARRDDDLAAVARQQADLSPR